MDKNTVICRCQEITYGEVLEAIREGAVTVAGVKKRVGSGMGLCQGKYCEKLVAHIISEETGLPSTRSCRTPREPQPGPSRPRSI